MSAGFTPGPWEVAETDEGHEIRMGSFVGGWFNGKRKAPHHHVEYTHGIYVDDDYEAAQDEFAEAEANARLIATAPDLYEALNEAESLMSAARIEINRLRAVAKLPEFEPAALNVGIYKAKATLAKARAGQVPA